MDSSTRPAKRNAPSREGGSDALKPPSERVGAEEEGHGTGKAGQGANSAYAVFADLNERARRFEEARRQAGVSFDEGQAAVAVQSRIVDRERVESHYFSNPISGVALKSVVDYHKERFKDWCGVDEYVRSKSISIIQTYSTDLRALYECLQGSRSDPFSREEFFSDINFSISEIEKDIKYKEEEVLGLRLYFDSFDISLGMPHERALDLSELIEISAKAVSISADKIVDYVHSIENKTTVPKDSPKEIEDKLAALERFAKLGHGEGVADFARMLFAPELLLAASAATSEQQSTAPLPETAPIIWSIGNRLQVEGAEGPRRETPPEFIRRVYGEWLGNGMTRAKLRHLDRTLSLALDRFAKDHGMPEDLIEGLPRVRDLNDKNVERWRDAMETGEPTQFTAREALRLASAAYRRNRQND